MILAAGLGVLYAILGWLWDLVEDIFSNLLSYLIPGLLVGVVFAIIGFLRNFGWENTDTILWHFLLGFVIGFVYEMIQTIRHRRLMRRY